MRRTLILSFVILAAVSACGGSDAEPATSTAATNAPGTTAASSAPTAALDSAPAIQVADDGSVVIDWESLEGVSFSAPVPSATDPLFFVHNDPARDGFFLGLEAYTVYGAGWTGQLGTFAIDCEANGICLHFDPDGDGPGIDLGFDFAATGTIEFVRADIDGFEAILTDVAFSDGTTIPGPLVITGGE